MNTRNKILFAILASIPCACTQAEVERRDLTDFTAVSAESGMNVDIRIGPEFLVEVDTSEDVEDIITEVRNGKLHLKVDHDFFYSRGWMNDYNAIVVLPILEELEASGGADVRVIGTVTGEELELNASGGSDLEVEVAVDLLDVTASGGSDVEVSGTANVAIASGSGGSDLDARQLDVKEAELDASGGSDLSMTVTESLDARASGGSDIDYYGDPQVRDTDESGNSDIRRH